MARACFRGRRIELGRRGVLAAVVLCAAVSAALAQDRTTRPSEPGLGKPTTRPQSAIDAGVTDAFLRAKIKDVASAKGLTDADRKVLSDLYTQALDALGRQADFTAKVVSYEETAQAAPAQIRRLKAATSQPASQPATVVPEGMSLEQMEARLKQFQLELTDLDKEAAELDIEVKNRTARHPELPKTISATQDKLKETQDQLTKIAVAAEAQNIKDARRTLLETQTKALQAELAAHQKELVTFDIRGSFLRAQQDATAHKIVLLRGWVKAWEDQVGLRRREEAARQVEAARRAERDAAEKHEIILTLRKKNTELAKLRIGPEGLNAKQEALAEDLKRIKNELFELERSFEKIRSMVKEVGSTEAIGLLLRQMRSRLPDPRQQRQHSEGRRAEMSKIRLRMFDLNETTSDLADIESLSKKLVAEAAPPIPAPRREDVLSSIRKALQDRKEMLAPLVDGYDSYFRSLVELDTAEKRLISQAALFGSYIDEQVFWMRSTSAIGPADLTRSADAIAWLIDAGSWRMLVQAVWADMRTVGGMLGLVCLAALIAMRRRMGAALASAGQGVSANAPFMFGRTLWAVVLTVLIAATGPLVPAFFGWRLASLEMESAFITAWGLGMIAAAGVWFSLAVVRQACRKGGLGLVFFGWPPTASRYMARSLRFFAMVAIPLVLLVAVMKYQDIKAHMDSLGRIGLILLLAALAVYMAIVFRPGGAFLTGAMAHRKKGWVYRYRRSWRRVAVLVPLVLACTSAAGYHYTATQLTSRLLSQIWVLVLLVVLHAMLDNWILNIRRELARKAQQRRTQLRRARQAARAESEDSMLADAEAKEQEIDLAAVDLQTSRLVRSLTAVLLIGSTWVIWADVLTALGILRQVTLWTVASNGGTSPVTLVDLVVAVVVLILTGVAYRNVSGLLEITLFDRFHVKKAGRYAISQLAKYVVFVVGVVWVLGAVGVRWASIQWLVAAMTVGLGFGLQEIFANFISGLIILFERPIRVGDTVTVGETSGTVTRIRIRATTITDWDCKELLVPNKEFVTGRLVNWTLSDKILRVTLKVGIAYGSDTSLAEKQLRKVAAEHPRVLKDPEPVVLFHEFGESSLNFELRVYIEGISHYIQTRHDLNRAIDEAFRQAGIEIAFPQRDIHVRSVASERAVLGQHDVVDDA